MTSFYHARLSRLFVHGAVLAVLYGLFSCSAKPQNIEKGQDAFLVACTSSDPQTRRFPDLLMSGAAEYLKKSGASVPASTRETSCKNYEDALRQVHGITIVSQGISSIEAIRSFPQLTYVDLSNNDIADIGPLSSLIHLQNLNIAVNAVTDLRPLASLQEIEEITASKNVIKDISPLSSLDTIVELLMTFNDIEDVSPLKTLDSLKYLNLGHNHIKDASAVTNLPEITRLYLDDNDIESIDVTKVSKSIFRLNLGGNPLPPDLVSILQNNLGEKFVYDKERNAYSEKTFSMTRQPSVEVVK